MRIRIRQKDINAGQPRIGDRCPIALRLMELFDADVDVGQFEVVIFDEPRSRYLELPNVAQDFIERFDAGETVKPFSFELKLEQPNGNENQ